MGENARVFRARVGAFGEAEDVGSVGLVLVGVGLLTFSLWLPEPFLDDPFSDESLSDEPFLDEPFCDEPVWLLFDRSDWLD